jgi:guanylate kinase
VLGQHCYGTPRAPVEQALRIGKDVVFDIDWQGHRQLRAALLGDVVGVFVLPPTLAALEQRLRARSGDAAAEIARRMRLANDEISHWPEFDHVVVNNELDRAVEAVRAVLHAARLATRRLTGLARFVERL